MQPSTLAWPPPASSAPVQGRSSSRVTWAGIGPGWRVLASAHPELPEVGNHVTRTRGQAGGLHHGFSSLKQGVGSGEHKEEVYLSEGFSDHGRVVVSNSLAFGS